ncbi:MAG: hypothetical protein ACQEQI_01250 [Bacillota bacterium]
MHFKAKLNLIIITLLLVLLVTPQLEAATAFEGGYSGLIKVPTADVLAPNRATIGYQHLDDSDLALFNYGVYDNFELGLSNYWYDHSGKDDDLKLNAKVQLLAEDQNHPAVALGVMNEDLYVAASRDLNYRGLRGHIGIGDDKLDGLFVGVSKTINPVRISTKKDNGFQMPVTTLMVEYLDHDLNLGAKFKLNSQFDLNVAVEDMDDLSAGINFNTKF